MYYSDADQHQLLLTLYPFDAQCCHVCVAIKHPVPRRMWKITNEGLTLSGTGCFMFIWQQWESKGYTVQSASTSQNGSQGSTDLYTRRQMQDTRGVSILPAQRLVTVGGLFARFCLRLFPYRFTGLILALKTLAPPAQPQSWCNTEPRATHGQTGWLYTTHIQSPIPVLTWPDVGTKQIH